jgi:hypothetical protein
MNINDIDLTEMRAIWAKRRAAVAEVLARTDPTGMTRPARDPDERAFLVTRGLQGPFIEVDDPSWREWLDRRRRPWEEAAGHSDSKGA